MEKSNSNALDLTSKGQMHESDCRILDEISGSSRKRFDIFIGNLIENNLSSKFLLFLKVTSRNSIISKTLHYFCLLDLIEERIVRKDIPKVIFLDDPALEGPINRLLDKHSITGVKIIKKKKIIFHRLYFLINMLKCLYVSVISWSLSKLYLEKECPKNNIVLLDTFAFGDSFDKKGNFNDRYYTNFDNYLTKSDLEKIYYMPTLYGLKSPLDYLKFFRSYTGKKSPFLFKETWLTLSDYLLAIFDAFILPNKINNFPKYRGIRIDEIILKELEEDKISLGLFRALCTYRFFKRASSKGLKLDLVINWFENHVNDRALNLAVRDFFPEVEIRGYQGFLLIDYYATYEPTTYEKKLGTIPHNLNVMNLYSLKKIKKTCPSAKVNISPAFRFDHLNQIEDKRNPSSKVVFIPFPGEGMTEDGINLVKNCVQVRSRFKKAFKIIVKPHPSFPKHRLLKYDQVMNSKEILFTDKTTASMYEISDAVIANGSVTCAESVVLGIPVGIGGNSSSVTMNPLPENFRPDLWQIFYNSEELFDFLTHAFALNARERNVEELFAPITNEGTKSLFCI